VGKNYKKTLLLTLGSPPEKGEKKKKKNPRQCHLNAEAGKGRVIKKKPCY
jgi:hypothetical protein